jgi:hypothetical protein
LRPDRITFGPDYVVDRYKFRLIAHRNERDIIVDVPREAVDDAAEVTAASTAHRRATLRSGGPHLKPARGMWLRSQAPEVRGVSIDSVTFEEWRRRHRELSLEMSCVGKIGPSPTQ